MIEFTCYSKKYSDSLRRQLKSVTHSSAKNFMYKHGYNSSSLFLPKFYEINNLQNIKLLKLKWTQESLPKRTMPLSIFAPKGEMIWRKYSLLNPYSFWHIVDCITSPENFIEIKNKLIKKTSIYSYSIPTFTMSTKTIQGGAIEAWIKFAEIDLINDSTGFSHLLVTDIRDFYYSIYTHSIAWALHKKEVVRKKPKDYTLLGNKLDKLFQNSRGGQTNGIPVGNMASDVIAELILTDIDLILSKKLKEETKIEFIASRYRDDYRFLCKSATDCSRILNEFSSILENEYDLRINSEKTEIYNDITSNFERPWKKAIKKSSLISQINSKALNNDSLNDILIETYDIQKKYPRANPAITIITKIYKCMNNNPRINKLRIDDSFYKILTLLRKIMFTKEDSIPSVVTLMDTLLTPLHKNDIKKVLLEMLSEVSNYPHKEYILMWLYHLSVHYLPKQTLTIFGKFRYLPLIDLLFSQSKTYQSYFNSIALDPLDTNDNLELSKVTFINKGLLNNSKGQKIIPMIIFRY